MKKTLVMKSRKGTVIIMQNIKDMHKMFAAHSPTPDTVKMRFEHCFSDNISIATLIKAPDNTMRSFEHSHDEYEFLLPLTPIPYLINEKAVYFGEVGWVFPVQSNRKHGVKYDITDVSHRNIIIPKGFLDSIMLEKGLEHPEFNYEFRTTKYLNIYIDAFVGEYNKGEGKDLHKLKHLTALICVELIDEGLKPDIDTRKETSGYQRGVRPIAEYLNMHYQQNISISELAEMCGFTPNYFSTCFKKLFGDSPQAYLNKLRISKAKQLLLTSNDKIEYIAPQCGFGNPSTFTTAFKSATGMTPTEYRENS